MPGRWPRPNDLRFYTHELRESVRYRTAGYATGQPSGADAAYEFWDGVHTATLREYGMSRAEGSSLLYHPSVKP